MKVALVTFASKCFYKNEQELVESARSIGIEKIFAWKYIDLLRYSFFWKNLKLLRSKRGAGYWSWHSIIIRKALDAMQENEWVVFCDAGLRFTGRFDESLFVQHPGFIQLFTSGHFKNAQYTKRDAFVLLNCDEPKYWNAHQVMGGFHFWRKCPEAYAFLDEYEQYCTNYQIVSDTPNIYSSNFSDFRDHRHPQSVMSILAVKYNLPVAECPIANTGEAIASYQFLTPNRKRTYSLVDRLLGKIGLWY